MEQGATRDHDPERIAVSGALGACSGVACRGRGVRDRAGPVGQWDREGRGRAGDRGERGSGAGALACCWLGRIGCWLGRLARLAPGSFLIFLN